MVTPIEAVHSRLPATWTVLLHTIWLLLLLQLLLFLACPAPLCCGSFSSCCLCHSSLSRLPALLHMHSLLLNTSIRGVAQQGGVLMGMLLWRCSWHA